MRPNYFFLICLFVLMNGCGLNVSSGLSKKRSAPVQVEPVFFEGVRYEVLHWGRSRGLNQNGGYVVAVDEKGAVVRRKLIKVYDVVYSGDMEQDKLDVFITQLLLDKEARALIVDNEKGEKYIIDLKSKKVSHYGDFFDE